MLSDILLTITIFVMEKMLEDCMIKCIVEPVFFLLLVLLIKVTIWV